MLEMLWMLRSYAALKRRGKDEGNADEKLSEMVIFFLHPPKKRKVLPEYLSTDQ
jgi:hypothetical protein